MPKAKASAPKSKKINKAGAKPKISDASIKKAAKENTTLSSAAKSVGYSILGYSRALERVVGKKWSELKGGKAKASKPAKIKKSKKVNTKKKSFK